MSSEVSKQEYLKRYLEKKKDRKNKKKPKKRTQIPSLKIINEDIDLKSINFGEEKDEDEDDEAPVVAEIIDERPIEAKMKEQYQSSRWKKIDNEDSLSNSVKENEIQKSNLDSSFLVEDTLSERSYAKNDKSSFKRSRHDSDSDLSPPRCLDKGKKKDYNLSSKRNRKNSSGSDISPPRNPEQSRSRHDSDSDISPHRHNVNKPYNDKQNSKRYNSSSNLSPRHNKLSKSVVSDRQIIKHHDSDSDLSPPRHKSSKSAIESKQKSKYHGSDSDFSPPRNQNSDFLQKKLKSKRTDSDSDISPPRHRVSHKSSSLAKSYSSRHDSDQMSSKNYDHFLSKHKTDREFKQKRDKSGYKSISPSSSESLAKDNSKKLDKTLSGLKAGLQNSKMLQMEVQELRERERNQLSTLDDEISGRNAGTIVRDRKTGLKRDLEQEQQKKKEENIKTKEYQKKYAEWGKGIEQNMDKVEKFKDDLYEMSKPLARYKDDEDLDERLKSIIHDDDPMAEYMKKKKQKDTPSFPVYKGPPAPLNRFGIQPGYRWDGVDRSNGFEKKYFEKINKSKAVETEAYLWSVQDM